MLGCAADREEEVGALDLGRARAALEADCDPVPRLLEADALGAECAPRPPRASRISRTASETSSSSRPMSRGPISTIVTSLPKRRYICPNSSPM